MLKILDNGIRKTGVTPNVQSYSMLGVTVTRILRRNPQKSAKYNSCVKQIIREIEVFVEK